MGKSQRPRHQAVCCQSLLWGCELLREVCMTLLCCQIVFNGTALTTTEACIYDVQLWELALLRRCADAGRYQEGDRYILLYHLCYAMPEHTHFMGM